jgi:hypothetical protein
VFTDALDGFTDEFTGNFTLAANIQQTQQTRQKAAKTRRTLYQHGISAWRSELRRPERPLCAELRTRKTCTQLRRFPSEYSSQPQVARATPVATHTTLRNTTSEHRTREHETSSIQNQIRQKLANSIELRAQRVRQKHVPAACYGVLSSAGPTVDDGISPLRN